MDTDKSAIAEHRERLNSLVTAVTRHALDELHALREQIDEVIRTINDARKASRTTFGNMPNKPRRLWRPKHIMSEALAKLRAQFAKPLTLPNVHRLPALEKGNGKDD